MLDLLRASSRRLADPLAASAILVLAATAVFLAWPGIDLWFSGIFYDPENGGFVLTSDPALLALRRSGEIVLIAVSAAVVASLALKIVRPDRPSLIPPRASLFLASTLALGPGLLVNLILKNNWGRPRPIQIEAFGGDAPFVGIWQMSDHCDRNCSFVSGEASSAIWIMSLALVVPPRWRLVTFAVTGVYALALSFNRIAFGGHFLSDVVLSWGLTLAIVTVVYRLLYVNPPSALTDERLEAGLGRIGLALRRMLPGRRV
jgi:membrane-associated PAP2 superfamily phosphatase